MKKFSQQLGTFFSSRLFKKWFLVLFSCFTVFILVFSFYTYNSAQKSLRSEFCSYSSLITERIAASVDNAIESCLRITNTLNTTPLVTVYIHQPDASDVINDIHSRLYSQLYSYSNGLDYLDSLYLYSSKSENVLSSTNPIPEAIWNFSDSDWFHSLNQPSTEDYFLLPRKKNGLYPYLLTILKPVLVNDKNSAIILNIDFSKIPILSAPEANFDQDVYIVNDNGEILFRREQENILESIEIIDELSMFNHNTDNFQAFIEGASPYIYTQYSSEQYPWHYITITHVGDYTAKLSDALYLTAYFLICMLIVALILAFSFVFISTSPLRLIKDCLQLPASEDLASVSEPELQDIISKIIFHMRSNEKLSVELQRQLELQNKATFLALQSQINPHFLFNTLNMIHSFEVESLGFDHKAPELTLNLSRLLQYALNSTDLVSLSTEFYYIELYLNIIRNRYHDQLYFDVHMDERLADIRVPKLIVQPLLENAVFHGFSSNLKANNRLSVQAVSKENVCVLTVADNGIGIPPEKLEAIRQDMLELESASSSSIGIHNTALRMHLLFASDFHIDIESTPGIGTSISLIFPVLR